MPRPRSPGYGDQHKAILTAAAQLFAQRGYTATTMLEVAAACGVSKPTLYHYVRDKHDLLAQITGNHVSRLVELVDGVAAQALPPAECLRELVSRFMSVYAQAQHEHRVLTEDMKFLTPPQQRQVQDGQRRVVQVFADALTALRPELKTQGLDKPLAMLLFGMMNWTFTWLRADGRLSHDSLAPVIFNLMMGGLPTVGPVSS